MRKAGFWFTMGFLTLISVGPLRAQVPAWCTSNIQDTKILNEVRDVYTGTSLNEFIQGLGGDDELDGGAGDDCINGNIGDDTILGGLGNDILRGGAGQDIMHGGDGSDVLHGDLDNDRMNGNEGNDFLYGSDGNDILRGGKGADYLYGENDNDELSGSCGDDWLIGGPGSNTYIYRRGDGHDTIEESGVVALTLEYLNSSEYQVVDDGSDVLIRILDTVEDGSSIRIKNHNPQDVVITRKYSGISTRYTTGGSITLTGVGMDGSTYKWLNAPNGVFEGQSLTVAPTSTTTYRVLVTNPWGCQYTDRHKVVVTLPCNPSIAGSPATTVNENQPYLFTPNVNNCGNAPVFSVSNLPTWAVFDVNQGTISGTPDSADVGFYGNIGISMQLPEGVFSLPVFGIEILNVPQAPVAQDDVGQTLEGAQTTISVLDNDSDPDGDLDPTSVVVISDPTHGAVSVSNGQLIYTPQENYQGADFLEYRVCDLTGLCDSAGVTLTIQAVNDPPVITLNNAPESVNEGDTVVFDVLVEDADGDEVILSLWENGQLFDGGAPLEWKAPGVLTDTPFDLVLRADDQNGEVVDLPVNLSVNNLYNSPLEVCANCELTTIQDAFCAAAPGETIQLLDPIHTEWDVKVFGARDIVIEGLGPDATILQGSNSPANQVVILNVETLFNRPNTGLTLRNLTFQHGSVMLQGSENTLIHQTVFQDTVTMGSPLEIHSSFARVSETTFKNNTGLQAGGISAFGSNLELYRTTLENNQSDGVAQAFSAGGLFLDETYLIMTHSTLSNNHLATAGAMIIQGGFSVIYNNTLSGNEGGTAGGILMEGGFVELVHNTIAFNQGAAVGGLFGGSLLPDGNILFGNTGGDCLYTNLTGTNLVGDGSCNGQIGDPLLQPLANNGGPTKTHLIGRDGDAYDAAGSTCYQPEFVLGGDDQRGLPRPVGLGCDLGAVELEDEQTSGNLPQITVAVTGVNTGEVRDNALVDSYSSCNGSYGGANTDIQGNIQAGGSITVFPGAQITGTVESNAVVNEEAIPVPDELANAGDLQVHDTQLLTAGDYYYQNITLFGGADLQTEGLVRIWFSGRLDIQSNGFASGENEKPANLWLLGTPGNDPITMQSNSRLVGVIYAPDRRVDIHSNAHLLGALVAEQFTLFGNSGIHFDEALLGEPCPEPPPTNPHQAPPVQAAIHAVGDWIEVRDNALVDSYDSNLGSYGGTNVSSQGDLLAAGGINAFSNAVIQGQVVEHSPSAVSLPQPPQGMTPNGDLNVNDTRSLPAGDYYFNNINISSNAVLDIQGGQTRIWFAASLNIQSQPENPVRFYDTGGNGKVEMQSNSILHGVIHTPGLPITIQSGASVYGGVTGYTIMLHGNASVHRDMSLQP